MTIAQWNLPPVCCWFSCSPAASDVSWGGGKLGDVIGALPTYLIMSLGQSLTVLWFPHIEAVAGLYLLAVVFGFTYSGVMSSILVCVRMMVSARVSARAMSLTSFFGWSGMGMGGFFGGLFFDINGDYDVSFAFAAFMGLVNVVILALFYICIKAQRIARMPALGKL
jgi:MFS family permease